MQNILFFLFFFVILYDFWVQLITNTRQHPRRRTNFRSASGSLYASAAE